MAFVFDIFLDLLTCMSCESDRTLQAPLIQVWTPNFGSTQALSTNQPTNTAIGISRSFIGFSIIRLSCVSLRSLATRQSK